MIIILVAYALVTWYSMRNDLAADGNLEIGFPYVFYKTSSGKVVSHPGFLARNFLIDLAILGGVIVVSLFTFRKISPKI